MWLHGEKCDISGISFVPPDFGYILASNFFQKRVVPLGSGSIDPLPIAVPSRPCWCVLNPCGKSAGAFGVKSVTFLLSHLSTLILGET
jgi:hypothetical protein